MTTGHVVVMGRKTFQSIGKPLPNRITIVLTRSSESVPGAYIISDLNKIDANDPRWVGRSLFICGGAEVYEQALCMCSDLYLTLVKREVEGDVFFPKFEDQFVLEKEITDCAEFKILHYRNVE